MEKTYKDKIEHITCLIENVGLNATRHQNQDVVIAEAHVVEEEIKRCFPDISNKNK